MPGIRNVVEARPVQDTQLAVVVLETEIEVLPERLHVGVVVEPVGDHAPLETAELVDRRDQQKEQHDRVCVMDPAPSIEHQSRHGDEKQADYDAFVPEKGTQQGLFVVDEDREQVQREHDESEDNERSPTAPPRAYGSRLNHRSHGLPRESGSSGTMPGRTNQKVYTKSMLEAPVVALRKEKRRVYLNFSPRGARQPLAFKRGCQPPPLSESVSSGPDPSARKTGGSYSIELGMRSWPSPKVTVRREPHSRVWNTRKYGIEALPFTSRKASFCL